MKHLLIILSLLLLSSPVIGDNHKGQTLYGWGEYPDYVWKGVGEKGTHHVYKGEVENGIPNGQGILTAPDGRKYVGEWENDYPLSGIGLVVYTNGRKYVGNWKNGKRNGQGTFTWSEGKYVGKCKDSKEWNGIRYDQDGNISYKIMNGERIKQ